MKIGSKIKKYLANKYSIKLQELLDQERYIEAKQLIRENYSFEEVILEGDSKLGILNFEKSFVVRSSKIKNAIWFVLGMLFIIIFGYELLTKDHEMPELLFLIVVMGLISLGSFGFGHSLFINPTKILIDETGINIPEIKFVIPWREVLITLIIKHHLSKSVDYDVFIFSKKSSTPVAFSLNQLEYSPEDIGRVLNQFRHHYTS